MILYFLFFIIIIAYLNYRNNNSKDLKNKSKKQKIKFIEMWKGFDKKDNYFTEILKKYNHDFEIVEKNPDIIIVGPFGIVQHLPKFITDFTYSNCKKVFYTGENKSFLKRDILSNFDLNITFENTKKYNNIRFPLWIFYKYDKNFTLTEKDTDNFCCFVYSHDVKYRNNFCKKLSNYKKVDCGGKCLNNIGGKVKDKIEFQKKYKFCIAYENSSRDGYTTEKILESYKSNCIPIYYGSKSIEKDFNKETFINAHDFKSEEDLIEYIKKVDNDKELYRSFFNKPIFSKYWLDIFNDKDDNFFKYVTKKIIE